MNAREKYNGAYGMNAMREERWSGGMDCGKED
jgi:hypothetical protein